MYLWKGKIEPPVESDFKYDTKITGRRWALKSELSLRNPAKVPMWTFGYERLIQFHNQPWDDAVITLYRWIGIDFNPKNWSLGYYCGQYDGYHHIFQLGPFWASWYT